MKKLILISLILFLMKLGSFMVNAQQIDFKASGYIDAMAVTERNVPELPYENTATLYATKENPAFHGRLYPQPPGTITTDTAGGAFDKRRAWMTSRARLRFDAIASKNLQGTIFLEIDSTRWGEVTSSYGGSPNSQRNNAGQWGADRGAVEVKNAFLTFGVPFIPVPTQLQVGIQPLFYRPWINTYTDGPGIQAFIKIDPANIKLSWFKVLENQDYSSDDNDAYGIDVNYKVGPMTIGGFILNYNFNTYPQVVAAAGIGPTVNFKSNMTWFGLYSDGKLGPLNINFDIVYDRGKIEDHRDLVNRARDVKYRGWATMLRVDYPWEKFNFGSIFVYGSGADARETDPTGMPGQQIPGAAAGVTSKRVSAYVLPPQAETGLGDLSLVFYGVSSLPLAASPAFQGSSVTNLHRGQIGGTWGLKLYAAYKLFPWYKVTLSGIYIGDTTKHGNTYGTARRYPFTPGSERDDKTIGWEIDLLNEFEIYKNLKLRVGGGVLFPGDALDLFVNAANPDEKFKNPYAFHTKIVYSF